MERCLLWYDHRPQLWSYKKNTLTSKFYWSSTTSWVFPWVGLRVDIASGYINFQYWENVFFWYDHWPQLWSFRNRPAKGRLQKPGSRKSSANFLPNIYFYGAFSEYEKPIRYRTLNIFWFTLPSEDGKKSKTMEQVSHNYSWFLYFYILYIFLEFICLILSYVNMLKTIKSITFK